MAQSRNGASFVTAYGMNLLLEKKIDRPVAGGWLLACYACLLPFGFIFFHDGWYGVGWGKLGWPLILCGVLLGFGSSLFVTFKGAWWQKACVLPTLLFFGVFLLMVFFNILNVA